MFITVTRHGGSSSLRLAAAAVAHITGMADGSVLHLLSGEHLRVVEPADDIEYMIGQVLTPELILSEALPVEAPLTRSDLDELLTLHRTELARMLILSQVASSEVPDAGQAPVAGEEQQAGRGARRGGGNRA